MSGPLQTTPVPGTPLDSADPPTHWYTHRCPRGPSTVTLPICQGRGAEDGSLACRDPGPGGHGVVRPRLGPQRVPRAHASTRCPGLRDATATYGTSPKDDFLLRHDEEGQGLAEYALILSLIAIIAIAALIFLGTQISTILSQIGAAI